MTEDISAYLKAIQVWLDHADQTSLPVPAARMLSSEEKGHLQTAIGGLALRSANPIRINFN